MVQNCAFEDTFTPTVNFASCPNAVIDSCSLLMRERVWGYNGWGFQSANGDNFLCVDTYAYSPNGSIKAFETFSENNAHFLRCGGTNCGVSANSAGHFMFEEFDILFTDNVLAVFGLDEPIISANNNAFRGTYGYGVIKNCRIIQQGFVNGTNASLKFIHVMDGGPNVRIEGRYPACDAGKYGYFEAPNYAGTFVPGGYTAPEYGPIIISNSGNPNVVVTGIRIVGNGRPRNRDWGYNVAGSYGNISMLGN